MTKTNSLPSSTDELLALIRTSSTSTSSQSLEANQQQKAAPIPQREKAAYATAFNRIQNMRYSDTIVSVVQSERGIFIARTSKESRAQRKIEYHQYFPFPKGITTLSQEFPSFLAQCLEQAKAQQYNAAIWSTIPEKFITLGHIRVPKLKDAQLEQAILWKARKEKNFNEKTQVLESLIVDEIEENNTKQLVVCIIIVGKDTINTISGHFASAGYPLAGLTSSSIGIQNILSQTTSNKKHICGNVFIHREGAIIYVYQNGKIIFSRTIKNGIDSLLCTLASEYNRTHNINKDAPLTLEEYDETSTEQSEEDECACVGCDITLFESALYNAIFQNAPAYQHSNNSLGNELTKEDVLAYIRPAIGRLVRQVDRTFSYFSTASKNFVIQEIYLTGTQSCSNEFIQAVGNLVQFPCRHMHEVLSSFNVDPSQWSTELAIATSLAFADSEASPNLLNTFFERKKKSLYKKITRGLYIGLIIFSIAIGSLGYYEYQHIEKQEESILALHKKTSSLYPHITDASLYKAENELTSQIEQIIAASDAYQPIGILGEITRATPQQIKLTEIRVDNTSIQQPKPRSPIYITGFIAEKPEKREATLSTYILKLRMIDYFKKVTKENNYIGTLPDGREVLFFSLQIDIKSEQ